MIDTKECTAIMLETMNAKILNKYNDKVAKQCVFFWSLLLVGSSKFFQMHFSWQVLYKNTYHNPRCFYNKFLDVFQQITTINNNDINIFYIVPTV